MPYTRPISRFVVGDYETVNIDSGVTQGAAKAIEFAAKEFNPDLTPKANGLHHKMIRMSPSVVPSSGAFNVTGIDPIAANKVGISEFEFAQWMTKLYDQPRTCILGYNNIKFDDAVTRHTLYRNLLPAYVHEFNNGNFRCDLYKIVMMVRAMNPEILEWPTKEDGSPSLKLEDLTKANGIVHENAHSAESDVDATAALFKLIAERKPKLMDHAISLTDKAFASELMVQNDMYFSINRFYGLECNLTKVMTTLIINPEQKNQHIAVDLNSPHVGAMLERSVEELKNRKFKNADDLKEQGIDPDSFDVPLHRITANQHEMVVPASMSRVETFKERFKLDPELIAHNYQLIQDNPAIKQIALQVFQKPRVAPKAVAHQLYFQEGFPSRDTTKKLSDMHLKDKDGNPRLMSTNVAQLAMTTDSPAKYYELALMAKWDNFYEYLIQQEDMDKVEFVDWVDRLNQKLTQGWDGTYTLSEFEFDQKQFWKENALSEEKTRIIKNVEQVVSDQSKLLQGLNSAANEVREEAELERANRPEYKALLKKRGSSLAPSMGI